MEHSSVSIRLTGRRVAIAAALWRAGKGTDEIAAELGLPEAIVANDIERIRAFAKAVAA